MNSPYLSCLKTYSAEIWKVSWLPPNILLAPILVLLRPSLILFFSMFLCLMLFLTPERAPKAGPATCIHSFLWVLLCCNIFYTPKAAREGPWRSASHHLYILCLIPTLIHKLFSFSNLIWYITIFILILNHTNISIGITWKIEKESAFSTQYWVPRTLMTPVWNHGCDNPPR